MFSISNPELDQLLKSGTHIICKKCGKKHKIKYGTSNTYDSKIGKWSKPKPSKSLGFYKCKGLLYLASVNGKELAQERRGR